MKTQEEREYQQWYSFRKSKRGKVCIDNTPLKILDCEDGVKRRVHGRAIVVMPQLFTRDRRKAFVHFAKQLQVALVPVEETGIDAPGCEGKMRRESRVTAYLAYGTSEALWKLRGHEYVRIGGEWYYATNQKPLAGMTTMARKPRLKGKDDVPQSDASGWEALRSEGEAERKSIAEAYAEADKWIAENVETVEDADGLHMLRETLCVWFCTEVLPPADLDVLAEFMEGIEWK